MKNGKNDLEISWIGTFPQNLALIHLMVSEKTRFTGDGRTTDDGATASALLTQSSRAKNDLINRQSWSQIEVT